MMQQRYIKSKDQYLFSCSYFPQKYTRVVLLLQGYSHSATDIDYFMSNVKNRLVDLGCGVVQFDPWGHGDSDGELREYTYQTLLDNLQAILSWICNTCVGKKIVLVTRGVHSVVMTDKSLMKKFDKCIAINPIHINKSEDEVFIKTMSHKYAGDFYEWFSLVEARDQKKIEDAFYAIGAKLKNLNGQYFNTEALWTFLEQLDFQTYLESNQFCIYANGFSAFRTYTASKYPSDISLAFYSNYGALPRDPEWHDEIINRIARLVTQR